MTPGLKHATMNDGSRNFIEFPETVFFDQLREYAAELRGAQITGFVSDWVTEVWLDFEFRGQNFSVNNPMVSYWFFVKDTNCPDDILLEVANHFSKLLEK